MEQAAGIWLTENAEGDERQGEVLDDLYKTTQQVMAELGQNREATLLTQRALVLLNRKQQVANGDMKGAVQRNMDKIVQKYTEVEKKEDTRADAHLRTKP